MSTPALPDDPDELWTTEDVAKLCKVAASTVRYWRHIRYGPPSARLGRRVRYRPADVRKWVDEQWRQDSPGAA